ncbi:hypothetical protein G3M48_002418 [Beauveria asiatica]|uniref:Uncharacterized protein n=1 Tax=Beauveria asiatica TaxID=1069075 RepID=A0AAW0RXE8_9HYPO
MKDEILPLQVDYKKTSPTPILSYRSFSQAVPSVSRHTFATSAYTQLSLRQSLQSPRAETTSRPRLLQKRTPVMTTLPPSVTENRHIPNACDSAKPSSSDPSHSRPFASAATTAKSISSSQRGGARRTSKHDRYSAADLDDDVALAKSRVRMPCDDNSQNTTRAAAAATTARTPNVHTESADNLADKAQIAALARRVCCTRTRAHATADSPSTTSRTTSQAT